MKGAFIFLFFLLVCNVMLEAQSSNINCATAFEITDPTSYCSGVDEFDNTNAGESQSDVPSCWDQSENDLWFTFVATDIALNISINGEAGGDLNDPQVALYKGENCTSLTDLNVCESTSLGDEIASVFASEIVPGDRYFVRVSARFARQGTFQICVLNYNPPFVPGQDCATASILCDKSSFVVEFAPDGGLDDDEAEDSCLKVNSGPSESNSTWFKWTCGESGTLTFDLTPLNIVDDLDFSLYRINGSINDCDLELLRCNASGANNTQTVFDCGPSVGLNLTSTDVEEDLNCNEDAAIFEDGYVRFIDMVAGESYALIINNYSDSEVGFDISFGGSGTFAGPILDFEITPDPNAECGTDYIVYNLSSSGLSTISNFEWDFGEGATPPSATGEGPFNVSYSTSGEKFIVLTVTSELGCQVTEVRNVNLDDCPESLAIVVDSTENSNCAGAGGGYIEVSGISGCPEYMFNIDGGSFSNVNTFTDLDMGNYTIGMMDINGCETDTLISILSAANFTVDAGDDVSMNADGSPTFLNVMTTAAGDVTITWDPTDGIACSDGTTNCLNPEVNPTATTTYTVTIIDENGCVAFDNLTVFVDQCINTTLDLTLDSIQSLICSNTQNGFIAVSGVNGELNYEYNIDGGTYISSGIFNNLGEGSFAIGIRDGNGCSLDSIFTIGTLPSFSVNAGEDATFNTPGDSIFIEATTTGVNIISAIWEPSSTVLCPNGGNDCLDPLIRPNTTTEYTLTVTDENGCTASDNVRLIFEEKTDIYIPNVFSPNEDGINDFFTILADPNVVSSIEEFIIFDRWGNKVYQGFDLSPSDSSAGWDGRMNGNKSQQGVYTWAAKVRFISKPDGEPDDIKGSITLIR